jgi:hypothetical protein
MDANRIGAQFEPGFPKSIEDVRTYGIVTNMLVAVVKMIEDVVARGGHAANCPKAGTTSTSASRSQKCRQGWDLTTWR